MGKFEDEKLLEAVKKGDVEAVRLWLGKGAGVNARDEGSWTPLHRAADGGKTEVAELLIRNGADVNARTETSLTPLHRAADGGKTEVAELLIRNGADVNARTETSWTPLHMAADGGKTEVALLLIRNGADVNARDNFFDWTPLHWAGNIEVAELLIRNGADVNARDKGGWTPLHMAALLGYAEIAELLIHNGADVNSRTETSWTPLHMAADEGNTEVARLLIRNGADVNARDKDGETPLDVARKNGDTETIELLQKHQTDLNQALLKAAREGNTDEITKCLDRGANIEIKDKDGNTPLTLTAFLNNSEAVKLLLQRGANKEAKGFEGRTALAHAAANSSVAAMKVLLDAGSDIEAISDHGHTALALAAYFNKPDAVTLLLQKRASLNPKKDGAETPLDIAKRLGHQNIVELLQKHQINQALLKAAREGNTDEITKCLDRGADIDTVDTNGYTPLASAVYFNHPIAVTLLLRRGANISAKNINGETPLDIAKRLGHQNIVELLQKHQTDLNQALLKAAKTGNTAKITKCLNAGANMEIKDTHGNTLLMVAAFHNKSEAVKLLLQRGAKIEAKGAYGRTALAAAALNGSIAAMEVLLCAGADINAVDANGYTPLKLAACFNKPEAVQFLRLKGATIDTKDTTGRTELARAATSGSIEEINVLLIAGADIEATDNNGDTPLSLAASFNNAEAVKLLLQRGANKEAKGFEGRTALARAAANGSIAAVKALLKAKADKEAADKDGNSPLKLAACFNQAEAVKLLLQKGANKEAKGAYGRTPLASAAANGSIEAMEVLLTAGANIEAVDNNGDTPLVLAAYFNKPEALKLLLKKVAKLKTKEVLIKTALWSAVANNSIEAIRAFFASGINPQEILLEAIEQNSVDKVKTLLAAGADPKNILSDAVKQHSLSKVKCLLDAGVNLQEILPASKKLSKILAELRKCETQQAIEKHDKEKELFDLCSLETALTSSQCERIEQLLREGTNIEATDEIKNTPLILAALHNNQQALQLLIKNGANIEGIGNLRTAALASAAAKGAIEAMQILLDAGANKEAVNKYGYTPLMSAVCCNRDRSRQAVELLVRSRVAIDAKDVEGKTALIYALERNNAELVKLLLDAGASLDEVNIDALSESAKNILLNYHAELGLKLKNLGQIQDAISACAIAQGLIHKYSLPTPPTLHITLDELSRHAGKAEKQEEKTHRKIQENILKKDEEGKRCIEQEKYLEAEAIYTEIIGTDSSYKDAYYWRGYIRCQLGKTNEAISDLTQAINRRFHPSALAYHYRSFAYATLGGRENLDMAVADFKKIGSKMINQKKCPKYPLELLNKLEAHALEDPELLYCLGLYYFKHTTNVRKAIDIFSRLITINDRHGDAYYYRACAYQKQGKLILAQKDFNKAQELLQPEEGSEKGEHIKEAFLTYQEAYQREVLAHDKLKESLEAARSNTNIDAAIEQLKEAVTRLDEDEHILEFFDDEMISKVKRDYSEAYFHIGMSFFKKHDYNTALRYINKAVDLNPDFADAYYYRGAIFYELCEAGKLREDKKTDIQENFRRAAALNPKKYEDENYEVRRCLETGKNRYKRNDALIAKKMFDRIIQHKLRFCTDISQKNLADAYFYKALCLQKLNDPNADEFYRNAIAQYQEVIDLKKDSLEEVAQCRFNIGIAFLNLKQYTDAKEIFSEIITDAIFSHCECKVAKSYFMLGKIATEENCLQEAIDYFEQAINNGDKKACVCLAQIYLEQMDWGAVRRVLEPVLQENPGNISARYLLGRAYLEQKCYQAAIEAFEAVTNADKMFVDAYYFCGIAKLERGMGNDTEKALELFERALSLYEQQEQRGQTKNKYQDDCRERLNQARFMLCTRSAQPTGVSLPMAGTAIPAFTPQTPVTRPIMSNASGMFL